MAVLANDFMRAACKTAIFEFMGTAFLVFMGSGSAASGVGVVAAAIAFGASVFLIAKYVARTSGAHLNPAITLASVATGQTHVGLVPFYLVSQFAGAICGAGLVKAVVPAALYDANMGGANFPAPGVGDFEAVLAEAIVTGLFVTVVIRAVESAAVSVGVALAVSHIVLIPITGCSVNPARSIGSAIFVNSDRVWNEQYIFVVGPLLGASFAALAANVAEYASAFVARRPTDLHNSAPISSV